MPNKSRRSKSPKRRNVVGTNSKEGDTMEESTVTMADMRRLVDDMQRQLEDMYRTIRSNEARVMRAMCGFSPSHNLWTFDQKQDIINALNNHGGQYMQALERFGYMKTRTTKDGWGFRHTLYPDMYPPLTLNKDTDIFNEWPADLISQIYLNDVVLYRKNKAAKAKITRLANQARKRHLTETSQHSRVQDATLSARPRRDGVVEDEWLTDEYLQPTRRDPADEWNLGGF